MQQPGGRLNKPSNSAYYIVCDVVYDIVYDVVYDVVCDVVCDVVYDVVYDIVCYLVYSAGRPAAASADAAAKRRRFKVAAPLRLDSRTRSRRISTASMTETFLGNDLP